MLMCLISFHCFAASTFNVQQAKTNQVVVQLGVMQETIILFPDKIQSISGVSRPEFQIEPSPNQIMIRSLQQKSAGNLFVQLEDSTLIAMTLKTVSKSKNSIIKFQHQFSAKIDSIKMNKKSVSMSNLDLLASEWKVKKGKQWKKIKNIKAKINYTLFVRDMMIVNFSIKNMDNQALSIRRLAFSGQMVGGLSGKTVVHEKELNAQYELESRHVAAGDTVSGVLFTKSVQVDHDQQLILRLFDKNGQEIDIKVDV